MKSMDFEKRLLNMTRCLLKHSALVKEEKDEIEDFIAQLLVEKRTAEAEKNRYYNMLQKERKVYQQEKAALRQENEILVDSVKGLAKKVKDMEEPDFWLEEVIEYKAKVKQIQGILDSLQSKEICILEEVCQW